MTTSGALTTGAINTLGGTETVADTAGNDGGAVTLISTGGNISVTGTIDTRGSDGNDTTDNTVGQIGGMGGNVTVDSNGTLAVAAVDVSGGDANSADGAAPAGDDDANGGAAGTIDLDTRTTLTLNGDLTAIGGTGVGAGASGADGTIDLRVDSANNATGTLTLGTATLDAGTVILAGGTGGGNDTLIGQNLVTIWNVTGGANDGNINNANFTTAADFFNFQNLTGGTANDTFNVNSILTGNINTGNGTNAVNLNANVNGSVTGGSGNDTFDFNGGTVGGNVDGNAGTDTLDFAGAGAVTINVNGLGATDGFTGTATNIGSTFDDINTITGSGGADTFTSGLAGTTNIKGGNDSYVSGGRTLTLTGDTFENFNGGAGVDIINVNRALTGDINSGAGDDTLNLNRTVTGAVTGGAGLNTLNSAARINGTYTATGDDTWNHTAGVSLATAVVGTGSLTIPDAGKGTLDIGGGDLVLPNLTGFTGHTVIGGTLTPAGIDPFYLATDITFNTVTLTVIDAITSGGSVTLLAGDIFLNNNITVTDGVIGMVAAGPAAVPGATTGVIDASAGPVTLTVTNPPTDGPAGAFIAEDTMVESENITLDFAGTGEVDVAVGSEDEIQFSGGSTNVDNVTDPDFEAFVTGTLAAAGLSVGVTTTFSINPASSLIGLETLAFIDVGLFEEELTLYGQIGTGIALALAQCEEQEGCAPNVSEDELNNLIESLEARLLELERRLAEEPDSNLRAELEELIDGYNEELTSFREYRQELQEFFSAEEEDEFEDEELDEDLEDEEGLLEQEADEGEVARLAKVLATIKARIEWLESLKANPEERERLGEATGIKLTLETLDTIIEAAESEATFIENQIRLLIEGTEAMLDGGSPIFTAEARDYNSMLTVHYGSRSLNMDDSSLRSLINVN